MRKASVGKQISLGGFTFRLDDVREDAWRRSSVATPGSNPVETAALFNGEIVLMRKGNSPGGEVLVYTREEWEAFIAGLDAGEFNFS